MLRNLAGTVGVWLLAGVALVAADFWEEKDFMTWSDKEVEKMLTDSPWAKQVRIIVGGGLTEGQAPAFIPGEIPGCGGEQFDRIQRTKVTITWSTAMPIRQASVRKALGLDAAIPPEAQRELELDPPLYVVTLSGLPPTMRRLASTVPSMEAETMLKRKNKTPIAPQSVRLFRDNESQLISVVYQFPKTDPITSDDKDIEFITKLGTDELKKKFKLADMEFADQLAL